jgi:acetyl-CoA synthetase
MLEYHGNPETTEAKFSGDWFRTGDLGKRDEDGYFYFVSRKDDLIISSGYRISPAEVENTLAEHQAVADCAVVGVPDETRGEVVKAFIELSRTETASDALAAELQEFVKSRLAAYEYPREIEFVDALPRTTTGKIKRSKLEPENR